MLQIYQIISLRLDVVQGSTLPLWKEGNKTFPFHTYKYHYCEVIILEDMNQRKKVWFFSVTALLVATSKTQHFNPWLYPWSCFTLGAAIDLKFYVMMAKKLKKFILKSERNHSMFVEARWPEMKPWWNSGFKAEKTTIFDFLCYFHFRYHSSHVVGNIDPRFSEKPLKFPNH